MTVASRIANLQCRRADLDAEFELLGRLPGDLPLSMVTRVSGQWHLYLSGSVHDALALIPPANARMTFSDGAWRATAERKPLDWNQRVLAVHADRSGVRWMHYLPDDVLVQVHVEGAALPVPSGYELEVYPHSTVLVRKCRPLDTSLKTSPQQEEARAWEAFFDSEGYSPQQKSFGNVFKALACRGQHLCRDMLPVPAPETMSLAGGTLHILRPGASAPETLPENSPLHGLRSVGGFWARFTKDQAETLVSFAASRTKDLEAEQHAGVRAGLDAALAALAEFEKRYLQRPVACGPTADVLTRWVQERTGYPAKVSLRSEVRGRRHDGVHSLWVHLWQWNEAATLRLPADVLDPNGFDFHDPEFYRYEPNDGCF